MDGNIDHDDILAKFGGEIDRHNKMRAEAEGELRSHKRSRKAEEEASSRRLHFKGENESREKRSRHKRSKHHHHHRSKEQDDSTAHPFPREPASPVAPTPPADEPFLSSLLDALADDEAADYWESVYGQPIKEYARPKASTKGGELEEMSDEEYAAWVKQKMWEKQHPEILIEREKAARKLREEAAEEQKRTDRYVRRRLQEDREAKEAWTRASRQKSEEDDRYDYIFDSHDNSEGKSANRWTEAWTAYLGAWQKLKDQGPLKATDAARLPWPTLTSMPPTRNHIEDFLRHMPLQDGQSRQQLLKTERVRWHPDKIQQRFQGQIDQGTMRVVTGIFQIIDTIWTDEVAKRE